MQYYTDMRKLGQGASGTVFVGTDVRTGQVRGCACSMVGTESRYEFAVPLSMCARDVLRVVTILNGGFLVVGVHAHTHTRAFAPQNIQR